MPPVTAPPRTPVTLAGMVEGARMTVPMLPGVLVFAAAVGAASAEKGLTLGQAVLMSATVYAGASQLLALQLWPQHFTPAAIAAMVVVTMAVNLRFVLMGAALQPWLSRAPQGPSWLGLAMLTDANFLVGSRHHAGGGNDAGVFVGAGLFMWVIWTLATVPGHLVGHMMTDPRRFAIDMVMPIVFTAMAVGIFRLRRDRLAWPVAAAVALATAQAFDGYWFIVTGALAGSLTAGVLRERT
ncbi:AzlC family ABC transporter permease [Phreatobacter sp.]|uniref:AzlC family ABC transporter permease n=1 Tax=Phreatobacter sp. TaxID=1966341 RepID=UPI003F70A93C